MAKQLETDAPFHKRVNQLILLVSVIIPNYNHGPFLKQRIDSVLNQTFEDFELIILDDCSTDNSREIIESYRHNLKISHIEYSHVNSGSPFSQWKKGVSLAKGDYVWIAESDDFADTNLLQTLTGKLIANVCLAYCQSWDVDLNGSKGKTREYWTSEFNGNIWKEDFTKTGQELLPFLKKKNIIPNVSACLLRKDKLKKSIEQAPNIESFKLCGDWFLWLLLFQQKDIEIGFSSKPLNYFRETNSSTRIHQTLSRKQLRILEEFETVQMNKHLFNLDDFRARLISLKQRWFKIHKKSNVNASFFRFARLLEIKNTTFLYQFIKYKWQKK